MVSFREALNVLNCGYLFLITGKLVGTIMRAYLASKHSEVAFMPPTLAWIILAVIIFGCRFLGETALKKNRPGQLKCYAVLVLVCVVWQVSAENYHVCTCNLNQTDVNRFVKQEIIAKFDSYPKQIQQCIQKSQQVLGCCGVDSWTDFGKLPNEMPDSCCGRYSPGNGSAVGHCTWFELAKTPGCNDQLFQIVPRPTRTSVYWIAKGFIYAIQLLFSIMLLIHSRRLQKQNDLGESEKTLLVSEQY